MRIGTTIVEIGNSGTSFASQRLHFFKEYKNKLGIIGFAEAH
jgi:hypothetical protein